MKKMLFAYLLMFLVAACSSAILQPTFTRAPPTDTIASPTTTPIPPTPDVTTGWPEYVNADFGYSFKYPADCSFRPMAADCKQKPPEERSPECLCFLNAENPNEVLMQSFVGNAEEGFTLVTFSVTYYDTPAFNPPEGEELTSWLNIQWSYLSEDMPVEPNLIIDGLPAASIYTPGSQQAFASENIFVIKDGKLIQIYMIDVDVEEHREIYENILATFQFNE
ncbi:membrane lipoprotein lipid attachment site-containing protein [Chloroflexota bacterium]